MRRMVDRLIYDTETATEIVKWSSGLSINEGYGIEETLYKTPNGKYFTFGIGGSLTSYADTDATGTSCSSAEIRPLTRREAAVRGAYREFNSLLDTEFPVSLNTHDEALG